MASSLNFNTDIGRFGAAFVSSTTRLFKSLCALFILLVISSTVYAQDDDLDTVLIMSPTSKAAASNSDKKDIFQQVVDGIRGDLEEDLNFAVFNISRGTKVSELESQIKTHNPKLIVLVENSSIKLYSRYQKKHPNASFPPSVAVAALFVERSIKNLKNATGIRYEIPAVTSAVNLRSLLSTKVKKIGVVHRAWMGDLIAENAKYCKAEGIELVAVELPNKDRKMTARLKDGLKTLVNKDVDAIWLLSDNALLNGKTLTGAWFPVAGKSDLPIIVGIDTFLKTKWNFGSFAIVPDHVALGVQAASIIGEIMDEDWEIGDRDIEQPLSVKKIVNINVMKNKNIKYREDQLSSVDEVRQ